MKVIPIEHAQRPRKNANPRSCWCGHYDVTHDAFGCRACEKQGKKCNEFQSKAEYRDMGEKTKSFAAEVAAEGFIKHIDEFAICTRCWGTVKLGGAHSITSVIAARAHTELYHSSPRESTRAEPG